MNPFLQAQEEFLRSISEADRSRFLKCPSAVELLTDVKKLAAAIPKKHRQTTKVLNSIHSFTNNLEPYFEVVGILVSSHPDVAAIAWGAFRLILQV